MFKKISIALLVVAFLAAGVAGAAYASVDTPVVQDEPYTGHRGPGGGGGFPHRPPLDGIAEDFGMTVDELKAELEAGKTIEEIAEEQGVDLDALALEKAEERLAQAVEDGKMTQEEADEKLEAIKESIESGTFKAFPKPRGKGNPPFRCGPKPPGQDA